MKRKPIDRQLKTDGLKAIDRAIAYLAKNVLVGREISAYSFRDYKECRIEISIFVDDADWDVANVENFFVYLRNSVQLQSIWQLIKRGDERFMSHDPSQAIGFLKALKYAVREEPWVTHD